MITKLKNLQITSTDLVDRGANPEAHIRLLKRDLPPVSSVEKRQEQEIIALKKQLAQQEFLAMAKKYESLGKNPEEFAPTLQQLKEVDEPLFGEVCALLDQQVILMEQSKWFVEIGNNTQGEGTGALNQLRALAQGKEKKENISPAQAMVSAYEENPELAEEYEKSYWGL